MKTFRRLFLLITVILFGDCVDPISFPNLAGSTDVVIYGQFTDIDDDHYVNITSTSNQAGQSEKISGAEVTLVDDEANFYPYVEERPGRYILKGVRGIPGKAYHIEVQLADATFRSSVEKMPLYVAKDSVYYEISEETFISKDGESLTHRLSTFVKTSFANLEADQYVRWDVDEVYYWQLTDFPDPFNAPPPDCFIMGKPDPQRIMLLDTKQASSGSVTSLVAERDIDAAFKNRHYVIVRQLSITETAYSYWRNVKDLLANRGSVFDVPPAPIAGNIQEVRGQNAVSGFFEVARVSQHRFFLIPGFIPYYLQPYCEFDPGKPYDRYPSECVSCDAENSIERPQWF